MLRSTYLLLGFASITSLFVGCGGDDDAKNIDAAVAEDANQSETGGIGRGRGGGGLEEGDGGGPLNDASADVRADTARDTMSTPDTATACVQAKCDEIKTRYLAAVKVAQGCLSTAADQCSFTALDSLTCGNNIPVNSNTKLKSIQEEFAAASCNLCPATPCPLPRAILGTVVCDKNNTAAATQTVGPNISIIDPGVIILPPIIPNDGTCKRILTRLPL